MKSVLLIEDDPELSQNIKEVLGTLNYEVENVFDGDLALRLLKKNIYDCIILDINLPGKSGFDVCKTLRTFNEITPVLMLTAFSELEDKVQGYESGADDYLTKPFYMRELTLRVEALIKRSESKLNTKNNKLSVDDLVVDINQKRVLRQNQEINLTPREFEILLLLIKNPGELVSKKDLITEIWGRSFDANTNTIEVYINFLRNKIDKPFGKSSIKTKVGYGYYFEIE